MDKPPKFLLPTPNFNKTKPTRPQPHFLTPSGMTLLPMDKQPPPMYGARGSTVPSKFLNQTNNQSSRENPPERHFCEPCEMELQSKDDYRRHRAQHEGCPVDGCKFKGHASVMDKHVTEVHSSGVFEKIKKLSTPEEIAAWRDERRKKYPTLANAKMRQLALEQRQKRGERLEGNKSRFGRREDRKRARIENKNNEKNQSTPQRHNDRNPKRKDRQQNKGPKKDSNKNEQHGKTEVPSVKDEEEVSCGIRMFKGTSKLKDYKHEKSKKQKEGNSLVGLIGMYGSDDETDDDESENSVEESISSAIKESEADTNRSEATSIKECTSAIEEIKAKTFHPNTDESNISSSDIKEARPNESLPINKEGIATCVKEEEETMKPSCSKQGVKGEDCVKESSDEGPEEAPIEHSSSQPIVEKPQTSISNKQTEDFKATDKQSSAKRQKLEDSSVRNQQQKRKYGLDYRKVRLRKQNTMLEKLLEPEIRHERNVLLQCVRFVCENNFFGIGSKQETK